MKEIFRPGEHTVRVIEQSNFYNIRRKEEVPFHKGYEYNNDLTIGTKSFVEDLSSDDFYVLVAYSYTNKVEVIVDTSVYCKPDFGTPTEFGKKQLELEQQKYEEEKQKIMSLSLNRR